MKIRSMSVLSLLLGSVVFLAPQAANARLATLNCKEAALTWEYVTYTVTSGGWDYGVYTMMDGSTVNVRYPASCISAD